MDVFEFIQNRGLKEVPNPQYNPKSKKNVVPPTILIPDTMPDSDHVVDLVSTDYMKQYSISAKDNEKYAKQGINYNPWDNLDAQLAESQSTMSKIGNSLAQTIVSELGLGTVKAITDMFGAMGQMIFKSNGDYSNPVSAKLEEWQEQFRAYAPIYNDPSKNIFNGGLADVGWWASNAPSIISSLTLLVPGAGLAKGLSLAAKGLRISSMTRKGIQAASKAVARATKSPGVYRALNRTTTVNAANRFLENGMTAVAMRGIENYQEARQVYNDSYEQIYNTVNKMSDEEYNKLVTENSKLLQDRKVDTDNRGDVAKALAKASADATFGIDWFNVGWDVLQLYGLKNMWKNMKNAPGSSAAIRREHRNSMRYFGKSEEEIKELEKLRPRSQKLKEWFGDKIYGARLAIVSEASEGAEEALNYVAQEEGMTYGKILLGQEKGDKEYSVWKNVFTGFDGRLASYIQAPQLYDSAFWGILGGVVFQGLGSKFAQIRNKVMRNKDVQQDEREESRWYQLDELPENKRRIKDIQLRRDAFRQFKEKLASIRKGIDIYRSTKNNEIQFADDVEQQAAVDRLTTEFITKLTLNAAHNGNLDLLKEWLANEDVRKAMVDAGIFVGDNVTDQNAESRKFVEDVLQRMNKVEEMYDTELMALVDAATILDKDASWGNTVPIEYLQIIASDNISRRLAVESINADNVNINERIAQLEEQFKDKLDANIDYRGNVRLAVLTNLLSQLRIQRRALVKDKNKSLSNAIALQDIDKRIKAVEDKLNDAELILATKYSIAAYMEKDGTIKFQNDQTFDTEALIYESGMTNADGSITPGSISRFESLSHLGLSERARTAVDQSIIGQYEKLLHDTDITYTKLRQISKALDSLYAHQVGNEIDIEYFNKATVRTSEELEKAISNLHNSMSQARKQAIDKAGKIIYDMYMKHGDTIKDYIRNKYNLEGATGFNQGNMTDGEIHELQDALDVLNLTKTYNKGLFAMLDNNFRLWDDIKVAMDREESESSSTSQNQPTPTPTQPQSQQADQNTFQRQVGKVRIKPNIDGGFDIETNVPDNEVGFNYSINGNGEIQLEWPNDVLFPSSLAANTDLYEGYNSNERSSDDRDMSATTHPILTPDANSRYQVKQKGRIVYKGQTNPSTGKGVTPSPAPKPAPSTDPNAKSADERGDVLYDNDPSFESFSAALRSIMATYNTNNDVDVDSLAVGLVEEQVRAGRDSTIVQQQVARAIRLFKQRFADRKDANSKMQSRIAEVISGQYTLTELTFSSPTATAYKASVEGLIKQYAVVFGIPERDGKLYVNLEDLLRFCNQVESDSAIASIMYNTIKEYLKTDEARKKFITTDENIDANNFLANVDKTEEVRRNERLESYIADVRVDITSIPNEAETQEERDAFYEAIDELDRMDKLTIKRVGGRIVLQDSKGRSVGSLAIPKVNPNTGGLSTTVEGWTYDVVTHNDGRIDSNLRDLFVRWLEEETPTAKELNNIIYEYAYGNPTAERKVELIKAFAKNVEIVNAKNNGFVANVNNNELLINHLAKLWRYVNNSGTNRRIQDIRIKSSVNLFFQKGYDSFANSLKLSKNPDDFEITVSQVTEGQLIKATNDGRNVKEYIPANKAISGGINLDIHKIGIASSTSRDTIITSGIGNQHYRNAAQNAISVTLPTRSGYNEYVQAAIANVNDDYISKDAKEIVQEIQNQIYELLNAYVNSPSDSTFSDIENFLLQVFDNKKGNSSLLYGLRVIITGTGNNKIIGIYAADDSGITIYKSNKNHTANSILSTNPNYEQNAKGYRSKTISVSDKPAVLDALKAAFEQVRFNVKPEFIESDNVSNMALRGLASRREGKFEIKVGDKTWTYNTFNEFILNNNLVRLNTKPNADGTSNYNRVSTESQRRNQTLRVAINSKTTSSVEGNQPVQPAQSTTPVARPLNERIISVFNSTESNKASAIFKELFGITKFFTEENLNALQKLNLLPKNIIFDEKFQDRKDANGNSYEDVNAEIDPISGEVTIGPRLIGMFESDPEQAIRKLIHEQLHYNLCRHKGFIRNAKTIFDEFKAAVNSNIPELAKFNKERLKLYFFDDIENSEEALEEFLVESLTSRELVDALNAIPADVKRKGGKNLLQKFLELMSKIFNWGITKNSLYEKEYYTVVEGFAKSKQDKTTKKKAPKTNELQTTLDLDEEITTKTPTEKPVEASIETQTEASAVEQEQEEVKPKRETARDRRNRFKGFRDSSITEETSNYTEEMQTIKEKAIANGTFMKAPNGNPTNLTERQWLQVRTKNFIDWFGDWINDSANASKVVDENGEPLVVYHGSTNEFNVFDISHFAESSDIGFRGVGFYFGDRNTAERYADSKNIMPVFLNIRRPVDDVAKAENDYIQDIYRFVFGSNTKAKSLSRIDYMIENADRYKDLTKEEYQGLKEELDKYVTDDIVKQVNTGDGVIVYKKSGRLDEIVVNNPNQIKSATSNTGEFSTTNDDIRHSSRTELFSNAPSVTAMSERLPLAIQPKFDALVAQGAIETSCR